MSLITVWMCVVWPRVHTLKDCNYQMRNLYSCRRWRCMLCPCKVRHKFFIHFWNRTILLCMSCIINIEVKVWDMLLWSTVSLNLYANAFTGTIIFKSPLYRAIVLPRYRVRPEKLTSLHLVKKLSDFYGTNIFIEICGLLGYYAASCGNCLPTFRVNVSVPSLRVKSLGTTSRYTLFVSTPLSPYWLSSHLRIATPPYFPESTL
jgi:hypothetical protein